MILDANALFSDDQSLVAAAGAILSEKSYDVGAPGSIPDAFQSRGSAPHDIGKGRPVLVECQVTETFDSAGDAVTCKAQLVTADNAALDSNLVVIGSSEAIPQATLVAGYKFLVPGVIPPGTGADRYIGMRYTTAVADATAGKITAGFVLDRQTA